MNAAATVFVVDDDQHVLKSLQMLLECHGLRAELFECAESFLKSVEQSVPGCLLVDVRMPGMSGVELIEQLNRAGSLRPTVVLSGHADVGTAVRAMKGGAFDFLEKPVEPQTLVQAVREALKADAEQRTVDSRRQQSAALLGRLSERQRSVIPGLLRGETNQQIANQLDVSVRTVQLWKSSLFEALNVRSKIEAIHRLRDEGISAEGDCAVLDRLPPLR